MKKLIAIPMFALAAGISLAACGSVKAPAAAPAVTRTVTAPAAAPKPKATTAPIKKAPAPAPAPAPVTALSPDPSPSPNWAGYAATGSTYTSVSASWTQPTVTCSDSATSQDSSFWVGLDGAPGGSQTVEQTGTEADCDGGSPDYYGWYEMLPGPQVAYSTNTVAPGDAMSASVVANGGGAFTLTLNDQTQGWTQTTEQTSATAQLGSAEIIAEAPTSTLTDTIFPLANFGTVNFTSATINGSPLVNATPGGWALVSGGVTGAAPSLLSSGNAFFVYDEEAPAVPVYSGTDCGGGVYAGANTSCPFAENVAANYTGPGADYAYSPVTGLNYTMTCNEAGYGNVTCTGGDDASVQFNVGV